MINDTVLFLFIVILSVTVVSNVIFASKFMKSKHDGNGVLVARGIITETTARLNARIVELESELDRLKKSCYDEAKMLNDRVDFLIGIISGAEKSSSTWEGARRTSDKNERVVVISNRSIYASALKLSSVNVSIVESDDVIGSLLTIPHVSSENKFRVVLIAIDTWGEYTDEKLSVIGDIDDKFFILVGKGCERAAMYLSRRSSGVVVISGSSIVPPPLDPTGQPTSDVFSTRYDYVIEGNMAAFCASVVSLCVKNGISIERAYKESLLHASEWIAERSRYYGKS